MRGASSRKKIGDEGSKIETLHHAESTASQGAGVSKSSRGRELPPCTLPWFKLLGPVSCSGGALCPPPSARTSPFWPRLERLCGVRPMGSWPVTPEPTAPTILCWLRVFRAVAAVTNSSRRGSRQPGGSSGAQMVRQQGFGATTGQPPRAGPGRHRRFAGGCRAHHPTVQNPGAVCWVLGTAQARSC